MPERTYDEPLAAPARPRLVLADDDAIVRSALSQQLGYRFECVGAAVNAEEAIALVEAHKPDVVILDVNMPAGGAIRATREIRGRSPGTAIVILSSDETSNDIVELLTAGAITYLRKGIDAHTLIETVLASIDAHGRLPNAEAVATAAPASSG